MDKDLSRMAELYQSYLKMQSELEESKKIVQDKTQPSDFQEMAKLEIDDLDKKIKDIVHELDGQIAKADPLLSKNVILEIRPGTGGLEAGLFAGDLFRLYTRFAAKEGFRLELISMVPNEAGGLKEAIASVSGEGAYGRFKFERTISENCFPLN